MADSPQTFAAVTVALAQKYRNEIVRQVNRRSALLRLLQIRPNETGKNVAFDVEADGMFAENFSDGADVADFGSDAMAPVTLNFALLRANFRVTDQARAAARRTGNPQGAVDLLMRNATNAVTKLTSRINAQLYTGTGTSNQIAGLTATALKDDNTYGGIDRTDPANAYWRSNVIDAAGAALTISRIRNAVGDTIYTASGEQPTIGVVSPALFNYIGSLYDSNRRYQTDVTVQTPRGAVKLDSSLGVIDVEGLVLVKDKDCPSGRIVFLNPEHVFIEYLPLIPDEIIPEDLIQMGANDGMGAIPLGMHLKRLATTGASSKFSLQTYLQLAVDKPNSCGVLTNFITP